MTDGPAFFDPHYHFWDVSNPIFDNSKVFAPGGKAHYGPDEYEAEIGGEVVNHTGGVYVECMSVCFTDAAPAHNAHCLNEAKWAAAEVDRAASKGKSYVLVLSTSLEDLDAGVALSKISDAGGPRVRGIRQCLNVEPDWPRQGLTGNLLNNEAWLSGYKQMPEGWSFDCQCNPHQFARAAEIFKAQTRTPVVVNHLGCPLLEDLTDPEKSKVFWQGMEALAALPHVSIKISMLCRIDLDWDKNAHVLEAIHKVIKLFGIERSMLASNFPVDSKDGWSGPRLFAAFAKVIEQYSEEQRAALWGGTARKIYRVQ